MYMESFVFGHAIWVLRPWQMRTHCCGHIGADTNVSPFACARNICVRDTKRVSDFVQKHFVSATNVSQFAQPKKHHGQQCVRNNVSLFARAFRLDFASLEIEPTGCQRQNVSSETVCVLIYEVPTRKWGCKVLARRIMAVRSKYSELPGIVSSFKPQYFIISPLYGEITQLILHLDNCWRIFTLCFNIIGQSAGRLWNTWCCGKASWTKRRFFGRLAQ